MKKISIQLVVGHVLKAPLPVWVLLGFSFSYLFFFIRPIFFLAKVMQFFNYVPIIDPIGADLRDMLSFSASLFTANQTPYIINLYPPLASMVFIPLLIVPFSWAYRIFTLVNIFCYAVITFVFPLRTSKKQQISSTLMLIFITGLFSYGFQFELERGQWNMVAVFMSFLAIWIYHYHNRYRFLAYVFFTISVQLKVFPLIFIVMLISDWRDWKNNVKRLLILAIVNFTLIFALGPFVFAGWTSAIRSVTTSPYVWIGNHSISSFVTLALNFLSEHGWKLANQYSGIAQFVLLGLFTVCIFLIMIRAYWQKQKGMNPLLLFACTAGALLIPALSHDYKLALLAGPVAILFSHNELWERVNSPRLHLFLIILLLIFSAAYSSTLASFTNKPLMLENNFPAIVIMLLITTILSLLSAPILEGKEHKVLETLDGD